MEYIVKNNLLIKTPIENVKDNDLIIEMISEIDINNDNHNYDFIKESKKDIINISIPKAETYNHYYLVILPINEDTFTEKKHLNTFEFAIYILEDRIIFIGDIKDILKMLEEALGIQKRIATTLGDIIIFVFLWILSNEQAYIENLENMISDLENKVVSNEIKNFNEKAMSIRKSVLFASHYYEQFIDLLTEFIENENELLNKNNIIKFGNLLKKAERLNKKSNMLQDYIIQLREMYQTQMDLEQNKIMRILTVVTTIFAPLTLITGWFGMNFEHMLFLKKTYAYPLTMTASICISVALIIYFRRKKYF